MSTCPWHRRPLTLLLPLLVAAILIPILIGRCSMNAASATPLGHSAQRRHLAGEGTRGPVATRRPVKPLRLDNMRLEHDHYVIRRADGSMVELSLDPFLQSQAFAMLRHSGAKVGSVVVLSIPDGRVLALAGYSRANPDVPDPSLAMHAWAPAASVFKIVTAAALLTVGAINPSARVCYHGGSSRLVQANIQDIPALDRRCGTLADAIGFSTNSIIGKLAHRYLTPEKLEAFVEAFGFNSPVAPTPAFPLAIPESPAEIPEEELEFARTAAGFWHVYLSPVHAARIASAFANNGTMVTPRLVERVRHPDGMIEEPGQAPGRRIIPVHVARAVGQMMVKTTRQGTARSSFVKGSRRLLPFDVAGKTGTLAQRNPYLHYNWFVGFAPADNPRIAFSVIVGSEGPPVKAAALARDVLREAPVDPRHPPRHREPRFLLAQK